MTQAKEFIDNSFKEDEIVLHHLDLSKTIELGDSGILQDDEAGWFL